MADDLDRFLDFMSGPTRTLTPAEEQLALRNQTLEERVRHEAIMGRLARIKDAAEYERLSAEYRAELAGGPKAKF